MSTDERDRPEPGSGRVGSAHSPQEFDASYQGTPPWDIGRPQPAMARLAESGAFAGRVLDAGCGTGEHALLAAGLGLDATGVDASPTAIGLAERKARERKLSAQFMVWDALDLRGLGRQFDTVVDSGLFHVFDDRDRARYVESLRSATASGGRYLMLCFSDRQPGDWGPRRVTEPEIRSAFADGWRIDSIEQTIMDVTLAPEGVEGWLSAITRH